MLAPGECQYIVHNAHVPVLRKVKKTDYRSTSGSGSRRKIQPLPMSTMFGRHPLTHLRVILLTDILVTE